MKREDGLIVRLKEEEVYLGIGVPPASKKL